MPVKVPDDGRIKKINYTWNRRGVDSEEDMQREWTVNVRHADQYFRSRSRVQRIRGYFYRMYYMVKDILYYPFRKPQHLTRRNVGGDSEKKACRWLREHGFMILDKNYYAWVQIKGKILNCEVDIVAQDGLEVVFVEVRSRLYYGYENPVRSVNFLKRRKILSVSQVWLREHHVRLSYRYDIMSVMQVKGKSAQIFWYPSAFSAEK